MYAILHVCIHLLLGRREICVCWPGLWQLLTDIILLTHIAHVYLVARIVYTVR